MRHPVAIGSSSRPAPIRRGRDRCRNSGSTTRTAGDLGLDVVQVEEEGSLFTGFLEVEPAWLLGAAVSGRLHFVLERRSISCMASAAASEIAPRVANPELVASAYVDARWRPLSASTADTDALSRARSKGKRGA